MIIIPFLTLCLLLVAQVIVSNLNQRKIMTALDALNANVQAQTAVVTEAVSDITSPHPTDAQVQAAADAVQANTQRLTDALHPPTPSVPAPAQ